MRVVDEVDFETCMRFQGGHFSIRQTLGRASAWIVFNQTALTEPSKMERAIVLINLNPGAEEQSLKELRQTPGVTSVYQLYGLYDMLVVVEGADDQVVKAIISDKLRSRPGVVSTITMKVLS